jgi:hypothetical protein
LQGLRKELMDEFLVYFNKRKQWLRIVLWDVHPTTFDRWKAGRWGYFIAKWQYPEIGEFGEVHLVRSRVREDLVVHELFHALIEWMWANRKPISSGTEERFATILDTMTRNFYKEYNKLNNKRR